MFRLTSMRFMYTSDNKSMGSEMQFWKVRSIGLISSSFIWPILMRFYHRFTLQIRNNKFIAEDFVHELHFCILCLDSEIKKKKKKKTLVLLLHNSIFFTLKIDQKLIKEVINSVNRIYKGNGSWYLNTAPLHFCHVLVDGLISCYPAGQCEIITSDTF